MKSSRRELFAFAVAVFAAAVSFLPAVGGDAVDWKGAERVVEGVEMVRFSRSAPRPIKAIAMRADLSVKTLFFTANGRDAKWGEPMPYCTNLVVRTRRVTAEEFLLNARAPVGLGGRGLDMVAAFNTGLWTPCPEPIPTPYGQPHGLNISDGVIVSPMPSDRVKGAFVVWKDGGMDILPTPLPQSMADDAWIAHSGWDIVLKDGKPRFTRNDSDLHPRTVLGLSRDRRWFYVLAVEGRRKDVSEGADYSDLADMMLSLGASDAVNMDGGGSTELVRWDDAARKQVTCFSQETPPRRDALFIGICRRAGGSAQGREASLDGAALFDAAIDGDRSRCGGIYHSYEFREVRDTPPPAGYSPFYLSHYGRHGSRYMTGERHMRPVAVLEEADKAGRLHSPGKELLRRLRPVVDAHKGMFGMLSEKGAEEHRRLARRMYGRYPSVFAGKGKVRCQASVWPRCISSMANFACSLKGEAPDLDFEFATGQRYMDVIAHAPPGDSAERKERIDAMSAGMLREFVDPRRIVNLLFEDSPESRKIVCDPHRFAAELFELASAFQPLERELDGLDVWDYFTRDEILALARYFNCNYHLRMGNSAEFGEFAVAAAEWLAKDIVERADEAARSGAVRADLRFGHDSGLFPLAARLGIEGAGARVPASESWKHCQLWREMPMAANIQIVLYRNRSGDRLAKVLLNEREVLLEGLSPVCGPYYRWNEFKNAILKRSADAG